MFRIGHHNGTLQLTQHCDLRHGTAQWAETVAMLQELDLTMSARTVTFTGNIILPLDKTVNREGGMVRIIHLQSILSAFQLACASAQFSNTLRLLNFDLPCQRWAIPTSGLGSASNHHISAAALLLLGWVGGRSLSPESI